MQSIFISTYALLEQGYLTWEVHSRYGLENDGLPSHRDDPNNFLPGNFVPGAQDRPSTEVITPASWQILTVIHKYWSIPLCSSLCTASLTETCLSSLLNKIGFVFAFPLTYIVSRAGHAANSGYPILIRIDCVGRCHSNSQHPVRYPFLHYASILHYSPVVYSSTHSFIFYRFITPAIAEEVSTFTPDRHPYIHPTAGDVRSPCPALNTLANHGYMYVSWYLYLSHNILTSISLLVHGMAREYPRPNSSMAWPRASVYLTLLLLY